VSLNGTEAADATDIQMGDATNMVIILGGELLKKAENLLILGLHPSEIIKGYELALAKALSELERVSLPRRVLFAFLNDICGMQNYQQQVYHRPLHNHLLHLH